MKTNTSNEMSMYKRIRRWHFIVGLLTLPFVIVLAASGGIYLFKPQITQFSEARLGGQALHQIPKKADQLLQDLLLSHPSAKFKSYTLARSGDNSVEIELSENASTRTYWLDVNTAQVLKEQNKKDQFLQTVKDLHGNLLAGSGGSYLVELAASWMIVLIISGVYLSLANKQGRLLSNLFKALIPDLVSSGERQFWRRLHVSIGLWISVILIVFLMSGLPWTQLWGNGFKEVQKAMGWNGPGQEFSVNLESQDAPKLNKSDGSELWQINPDDKSVVSLQSQDHMPPQAKTTSLDDIVKKSKNLNLQHPIKIQPPKGDNGVWTLQSLTPNRPNRETIHYDKWSGRELMHIRFSDYHPVKRIASYGIAFHEGALFGWANQVIALLTALGVILISVSGIIMWFKRRPQGSLGIPEKPAQARISSSLLAITVVLATFLPMLAISLVVIVLIELASAFIIRPVLKLRS